MRSSPHETQPQEVLPPPGFTKVVQSFDHGEVTLYAPESWTDVEPVQIGNGEPRLQVAPDIGAFTDGSFTASGLQIDAFAPGDGVDTSRPADTLATEVAAPNYPGGPGGPLTELCTPAGEGDFPAGLGVTSTYTGNFARFTSCRGAGSGLVVVAGPDDRSYLVVLRANTASPADEAVLPVIARSFVVRNFP